MNAVPSIIRYATSADVERILEICQQQFPNRRVDHGRRWVTHLVEQQKNHIVLLGERTAGCAGFSLRYGVEPRAGMVFLAAEPSADAVLEPLRMIRMMVAWAAGKGAKGCFHLTSDTGLDFGPFACRLGGKEVVVKRWEIPLEIEGTA